LPFKGADGTAYTLLGIKEVADDPGFDAWRDTTTLFTRIHAGGEDGPVVGAGIIRLGLVDLARQATTLRIMRSRGAATFARTALGFSRFFMTSLWDTYVRHR